MSALPELNRGWDRQCWYAPQSRISDSGESFSDLFFCQLIFSALYTVFHFHGCCSQGFFLCLRRFSFSFPRRVQVVVFCQPHKNQKRRVHGWQTRYNKGRSMVANFKMAVSTCCFMTEQVCRYRFGYLLILPMTELICLSFSARSF